ncbi:hypothetical protein [uncultured Meiothermus sp.]|jgi:hypothetical protein|uniref:hypothetical protein n=1 Tax=uncultured Meiothermus sp. TaxID=157471 RepID=UPI00262AF12A|nr:hypothetical protein [uncultured Meiothermus sp.]
MDGKTNARRHWKKSAITILISLTALTLIAVNGDTMVRWNSGLSVAVMAIVLFLISLNVALAVLDLLRRAPKDDSTKRD